MSSYERGVLFRCALKIITFCIQLEALLWNTMCKCYCWYKLVECLHYVLQTYTFIITSTCLNLVTQCMNNMKNHSMYNSITLNCKWCLVYHAVNVEHAKRKSTKTTRNKKKQITYVADFLFLTLIYKFESSDPHLWNASWILIYIFLPNMAFPDSIGHPR